MPAETAHVFARHLQNHPKNKIKNPNFHFERQLVVLKLSLEGHVMEHRQGAGSAILPCKSPKRPPHHQVTDTCLLGAGWVLPQIHV